jgi:protein-S-isoprenylcysteine O-methyltransferase Ste14
MGAIFWVGFFCYSFDHVNAGVALLGVHAAATSTPITVSVAGVQFVFSGLSYEMFGLDPAAQQSRWKLQAMFGMAALLLMGAAMMRTWATAYLSSDTVQDAKLRTEALVADGPYRYVRNPLYFSNVLMTLSMALLASRSGWVVIVSEPYRAYCQAVPRLWPSFTARVPAGGGKPRWKQAWLAEAFFCWGFAAARPASR